MVRKLILAALDYTRPKDPPLSLGHASILANLRKNRISVVDKSWSVTNPDFSAKQVVDFVMSNTDSNTDFAIGAFVWNENYTQQILTDLKKQGFSGNIIIGGPQVSYVKKGIEKYYPQADIFIRGYAEEALAEFQMRSMENIFPVIKGIHYANQPDLGLSATADFEKLPSPFLTGLIPPQRFIRWETQRGCPFRCSFCQHRESDISMKRKSFSTSRILEEAKWITDHPVIKDLAILDPTFNSGAQYLLVLEALADGKFSGKLALQCRIEMVTKDFLNAIEKLNQTANVVLECGLQTIHKEEQRIIERLNNMEKVKNFFQETSSRGIETEVSLIFGLPKQTLASFKQSVAFCENLDIGTINAFPLMLLRGTPLYDSKSTLQLVESTDIILKNSDRLSDGIPHVVSSPSFTYEDWKKMADIAEKLEIDNQNHKQNKSEVYIDNQISKNITFFKNEDKTNKSLACLSKELDAKYYQHQPE